MNSHPKPSVWLSNRFTCIDILRERVLVPLLLVALCAFAQTAHPGAPPDTRSSTAAPGAPAHPAAITTDKYDYPPGTQAAFLARGFTPGENVTFQVVHADGTPSTGADHQPWKVIADRLGNARTVWHVCEDDCVGSLLEVIAVGDSSHVAVRTRFTDSTALNLHVGYYDMDYGQGNPNQVAPILTAGHIPVNLTGLTPTDLCGLDILFVQNPNNGQYGADYLNHLADIQAAVNAGMVLILHDRYVDPAESILPGGSGLDIRRDFNDAANIQVLNNTTLVTSGPGGIVDDTTLDGGNSSSHGYAVASTLPPGATAILSRTSPDEIVTFSYPFGSGWVIYSTIPLDFYLYGSYPFGIGSIYAPNVVAYGGALSTGRTDGIDSDGDGIVDCQDSCPSFFNPDQANQVACMNMVSDGTCLEARVEIVHHFSDFSGNIMVLGLIPAAPSQLQFEILDTCGSDLLEFFLNGVSLGQVQANPTFNCDCGAPLQLFTVNDSTLIASAWMLTGNNTFRVVKTDQSTLFAWARVKLIAGAYSQTYCIASVGGSCDQANACSAGYTFGPIDLSHTIAAPFIPPLVTAPYQDSLLPPHLDISSLAPGDYSFCITGNRQGSQGILQDCVNFTKTSESRIVINGPGNCADIANRAPVAKCASRTANAGIECSAAVSIDDGSYDPDGDPITVSQNPPGPYPVGSTLVDLIVTDSHGLSSTCQALVTVFAPPIACIQLTPDGPCLEAQVQLSQFYFAGQVYVLDSGNQVVAQASYQDSLLPSHLDISGVPDGNYTFCVSAYGQSDCAPFTKSGQTSIIINGPGNCAEPPNRPPVPRCNYVAVQAGGDCGPVDASVDGGSYDPDGDSITFTQDPPGPYPVGYNTVQLTVTDSHGASAICYGTVQVLPPAVACISTISEANCLDAHIALSQPDFRGDVYVPGTTPGAPSSLTFDVLAMSPGAGDTLQLYLNDVLLASPTVGATFLFNWCPAPQTITVNDAGLIAGAWHTDGNNTFRCVMNGTMTYLGWIHVRFPTGGSPDGLCLASFSYYEGCNETCLYNGYAYAFLDQSTTLSGPFVPALAAAHYQDSLLPTHLDLSGVPEGDYTLCVSGMHPWESTPQVNCAGFHKTQDQQQIIINGPGGCQLPANRPPVAKVQSVSLAAGANCSAPASIDNGSYDPDGDAIVITQDPPGPYPVGSTLVHLTVTEAGGQSLSSDGYAYVNVQGPAVACINVTSEQQCLDAQISLADAAYFSGDVYVPGTAPGVPSSIIFDFLSSSFAPGDHLEFLLNGTSLGQVALNSDFFNWCPQVQSFTVNNSALIAQLWQTGGNNLFGFTLNGFNTDLGWVRARFPGGSPSSFCIASFSYYGEGCNEICLYNGYASGNVSQSAVMSDPVIPALALAHYESSILPAHLDISTVPDGAYNLCISGMRPWETFAQYNCGNFTKAGQSQIIINGLGNCQPPANRPPIAKCHNVTVALDPTCSATASVDNGSYDPDGDAITITQDPPGPYPQGATLVHMTATDPQGASSSCDATVFVLPSPPVIHCPANIVLTTAPGEGSAVANYNVTAASPCFGPVLLKVSPPSGSRFGVGTTTISCHATDSVGNTADCSFTVTVEDHEPPTITCPANIVVPASHGAPAVQFSYNFNDGQLPAGTTTSGFARIADDGTGANAVLHLTDDGQLGGNGVFVIPDPAQGHPIDEMHAHWRSLLGGATSGAEQFGRFGADGYSFNWVNYAATESVGEEGTGLGLTVTVDTWDNGGGEAPALDIRWNGIQIAFDNINPDQGLAKDFLRKDQFVDVDLTVTRQGLVTFNYDGRVLTAQIPQWAGIAGATFVIGARTGAATDNQWIDDLSISATPEPRQCTQIVNFKPTTTDNHDGKVNPGTILQEIYFGIQGWFLPDLFSSPKYPNFPDLVRTRTSLEANQADEFQEYGTRLSGYLRPPVSGDYVFYLASDDESQFWLSTDDNPANLALVAHDPTWANRRQYNGESGGGGRGFPPSNISPPITLTAGRRYYFQAIMKQGTGGDNLAVAWQMPGDPPPADGSEPISGAYLEGLSAPPAVVSSPPSGSVFPVGNTPVICTATDSSGNSATCGFYVTVLGTICGKVFYDANANGIDNNEAGLAGWKLVFKDSHGTKTTVYTDSTGHFCVDAAAGTYTVTSVPPGLLWVGTTPVSQQVTVGPDQCQPTCNFGEASIGVLGNTFGDRFWTDSSSQTVLTANDPAWRTLLNACN